MWIRNVQMGLISALVALVTVYVSDAETVRRKGFYVGYSPMVVSVITVQAVGGLVRLLSKHLMCDFYLHLLPFPLTVTSRSWQWS